MRTDFALVDHYYNLQVTNLIQHTKDSLMRLLLLYLRKRRGGDWGFGIRPVLSKYSTYTVFAHCMETAYIRTENRLTME